MFSTRSQAKVTTKAVEPPTRGKEWIDLLSPVLNGTYTCDFTTLNFKSKEPYVRVDETCSLLRGKNRPEASSCMLALLAYLISQPSVFYVEAYPVIKSNNNIAQWVVQSGVDGSRSVLVCCCCVCVCVVYV